MRDVPLADPLPALVGTHLTGGLDSMVALNGPIDGRPRHAEEVAELGGAVLASPVQRHAVRFLARVLAWAACRVGDPWP